jgi:Spy/CpxP family protein refolding chaperone
MLKLHAALWEYDQAQGAHPDAAGNVAGVDRTALLGVAGYRAELMFKSFGPLRKVLTPEQAQKVQQLMTAMWQDGFTARATYDHMYGSDKEERS